MALVDYGSDSGGSDKEDLTDAVEETKPTVTSLFKKLPEPKRAPTVLPELNDDVVTLSTQFKAELPPPKRKKIKIAAPSIVDSDSDDDDKLKPLQPKKESSLISMLPKPRHVLSSASLIPDSVKRKVAAEATNARQRKKQSNIVQDPKSLLKEKPPADTSTKFPDFEENTPFFSMPSDEVIVPAQADAVVVPPPLSVAPPAIAVAPETRRRLRADPTESAPQLSVWDDGATISSASTVKRPRPDPTSDNSFRMDDEFIRMQGKRAARDERINIVEVDVSQELTNQSELLKNITDESQPTRSFDKRNHTDGPGRVQTAKHQITYLAYEAKAREQELKNEWARNRQTKRETQMKYGF